MLVPHRTRVLVVDDNQDMVDSLCALLEGEGHNAKGIYGAQTIVADAQVFDPDVVIMDIAMPGRSGWDAAVALRKYRIGERPMLIALTGEYMRDADRVLAKLTGFGHYLMKPCDPKVLLILIASYPNTRLRSEG